MQPNHGSLEGSANNAEAGGQVASGEELNTHARVDGGQAPNLDSATAETLSSKTENPPEPLAIGGAATAAVQQYSETPDKREEPPTTSTTSVAATAIPPVVQQEAEEELQKPVVASAPDDSGPTEALASAGKESLLQPAATTNSAPNHHQQTDDHQPLSDAKLNEVCCSLLGGCTVYCELCNDEKFPVPQHDGRFPLLRVPSFVLLSVSG